MTVCLCCEAVDSRKGINGLAALIEQTLERDPFSEQLFVFRNRARDQLRLFDQAETDAEAPGGEAQDNDTAELVRHRRHNRGRKPLRALPRVAVIHGLAQTEWTCPHWPAPS